MKNIAAMATRVALVISVVSLSGCGWFKFGSQYDDVEESKPLEVPPDLSTPDTRGEILVPPAPEGETRTASRTETQDAPGSNRSSGSSSADAPTPAGELPADNERVALQRDGEDVSLMVFDRIDSVWRRTGFALERAGFLIDDRDEARRLYQIDYQDTPPEAESKGFFGTISGWFGSDDDDFDDLSGQYGISLIGEGDRTRVVVLDDAGNPVQNRAAINMLILLHERLS